jgi:excisionase family DNA binding protein
MILKLDERVHQKLLNDVLEELYFFKPVLTAEETAKFLGISMSDLYKKTSKRIIPFSRPCGKLMFFSREKLIEFALQNEVKTVQQLEKEVRNGK